MPKDYIKVYEGDRSVSIEYGDRVLQLSTGDPEEAHSLFVDITNKVLDMMTGKGVR